MFVMIMAYGRKCTGREVIAKGVPIVSAALNRLEPHFRPMVLASYKALVEPFTMRVGRLLWEQRDAMWTISRDQGFDALKEKLQAWAAQHPDDVCETSWASYLAEDVVRGPLAGLVALSKSFQPPSGWTAQQAASEMLQYDIAPAVALMVPLHLAWNDVEVRSWVPHQHCAWCTAQSDIAAAQCRDHLAAAQQDAALVLQLLSFPLCARLFTGTACMSASRPTSPFGDSNSDSSTCCERRFRV
jgi:hypothetical protein